MSATHANWCRVFFATQTSDLATNTTLGTATRLNFPTKTITIPETGSRTFLSVILRVTFSDHYAAANAITAIRMGIQLGAAAAADTDRSWSVTATTNEWNEVTLDCTAYFNTNFGAASTQTCVAALALATTSATNVGGNITADLEIEYAYDDAVGSTRLRCIPIGIGSQGSTLTAAQTEIGSDGTNGPGTSQIPILTGGSGLIKEASPTIVDSAIELNCIDGAAVTGDLNPEVQIDSSTVSLRGVVGYTSLSGPKWYRDVFNYDTTTFSTTTTHALKMRDTTTTGRYHFVGGVLWVTYTYDKSSTTRILNVAQIFAQQPSGDYAIDYHGGVSNAVAADATAYFFALNIQEPGTITLERAVAVVHTCDLGSGTLQLSAGAQAFRSYTYPAAGGTTDNYPVHHRADYGSAWSLARGDNRLELRQMCSTAATQTVNHAYAWILYSSDVPSGGVAVATRPSSFHGASYTATSATIQSIAAAGQIAPSFVVANWTIQSAFADGRQRSAPNANVNQLRFLLGAGEYDAVGWQLSGMQRKIGSRLHSIPLAAMLTAFVNRTWLASGKMALTTARRVVFTQTATAGYVALIYRATYHAITFTVAGTLTIDGVAAANGKTIKVWAYDANNVVELVTTTTTAGGAGAFTCQVPDSTRSYFATYQSGSDSGASVSGTPGSSTFNIAIRALAGDVTITGTPTVSSTSSSASFTFTSNRAAEYSLDGATFAPATSPINLTGLAIGVHALTIRDIADTTKAETFTWTVASAGGGPVIVTNNVTTAELIRDRVIALIAALAPVQQPTRRFLPFDFEDDGDFEAWSIVKTTAPFRRFAVRDTGADRRPQARDLYVEEHFVTLEIAIAYPQTAMTGKKQTLDRDDVSAQDRHQIEQAVCVNGYANFVGATFPNATPLDEGDPVVRKKLDGSDLVIITQTYRYWRRMIP